MVADTRDAHRTDEPTMGELVHNLSEQTSQLVRDELRLARAELREKGRHAGLGLGLFSGAGLLALFGAACLVATVILLLALVVPAWLAALVVTLVLLAAAGVAALLGRKEVRRSTPPVPGRTMDNVRLDVQAMKHPAEEGTDR